MLRSIFKLRGHEYAQLRHGKILQHIPSNRTMLGEEKYKYLKSKCISLRTKDLFLARVKKIQ
ncbi:hypothetical protein ACTXT7_005332 [Hymenolepis weldensis]